MEKVHDGEIAKLGGQKVQAWRLDINSVNMPEEGIGNQTTYELQNIRLYYFSCSIYCQIYTVAFLHLPTHFKGSPRPHTPCIFNQKQVDFSECFSNLPLLLPSSFKGFTERALRCQLKIDGHYDMLHIQSMWGRELKLPQNSGTSFNT